MTGVEAPTLRAMEAAAGEEPVQPAFGSSAHIKALEQAHPGKVAFFVRHRVPTEAFPNGFEAVLLADRKAAVEAYRAGALFWKPGEIIDIREAR